MHDVKRKEIDDNLLSYDHIIIILLEQELKRLPPGISLRIFQSIVANSMELLFSNERLCFCWK